MLAACTLIGNNSSMENHKNECYASTDCSHRQITHLSPRNAHAHIYTDATLLKLERSCFRATYDASATLQGRMLQNSLDGTQVLEQYGDKLSQSGQQSTMNGNPSLPLLGQLRLSSRPRAETQADRDGRSLARGLTLHRSPP